MKNFYKLISLVFQPLLMPTFAMLLLMNMDIFTMLPTLWRWIAIVGTFVFTGLLPALPIYMMMRRGEVNDLFISKREERTMPYLFSFMAYVFWALFLWRTMQLPLFIVSMGMSSALSILAILIINLRWKISAHMAGIGGFAGSVFGVCYRMAINPLWFFVGVIALCALVALSRIELKAHTPSQTLAGFLIGFGLVFGASFVF
jgi:membrane-associated phospholipid phosphatase